MRSVVITASDDGLTVQDKRENVPIDELAALQTLSDARPGSEALCKNADGRAFLPWSRPFETDGACTVLKQAGEKQSVAFTRLLGGGRIRRSCRTAIAGSVVCPLGSSCKSFCPG